MAQDFCIFLKAKSLSLRSITIEIFFFKFLEIFEIFGARGSVLNPSVLDLGPATDNQVVIALNLVECLF